jgi:hypothetical protein
MVDDSTLNVSGNDDVPFSSQQDESEELLDGTVIDGEEEPLFDDDEGVMDEDPADWS